MDFAQFFSPDTFEQYIIPWAINITFAIAILAIGRAVVKGLMGVVKRLLIRAHFDEILVNFLCAIGQAVLLLFVIIASLEQLGVNTTSLIALLGAAGLAVGLALQNSLANFSAGVMLIMFRPFKAGDYVEAGGTAGVVETISIFATTFRTPDNREVIVPNGAIYGGNIINYSARETRRIDMVFGIGYDDDLQLAKQVLEQIIGSEERILPEPAPIIAVGELADSSVNFYVRPWVNTADYWAVYFDLTEKVKLTFDERGISIPYPQMDVHLPKPDEAAA